MLKIPFSIVQVTDLHIGETPELNNGIDVRKNFQNILSNISVNEPDLLVLTGDLAANMGEPGAYEWLQKVLAEYSGEVAIMSGNHDVLDTMVPIMGIESFLQDGELFYKKRMMDKTMFFLDTTPDHLSEQQLEWLAAECKELGEEEALLFMHHPPVYCACEFMDNRYPLKNRGDVWKVLKNIPNIKHIFCGHYHADKTVYYEGKNVYLTPSSHFQIGQHSNSFQVDHNRAGWRSIYWSEEQLITSVHYLS